jgi:8-oxo-dGTP pyrophosphatase MutT (NUDIX family)
MASIVSNMVEVCAFRFRNDKPEVLLLRRAKDEVVYPGMWQLITGRVLEGETSLRAARRELQEETGLMPLRFWIVPFTSSFYDVRQDAIVVMPFFAAQLAADALPILSHEHDSHEWLAFPEAEGRLVWPGQRQGITIVRQYLVCGAEAGRLLEIVLS